MRSGEELSWLMIGCYGVMILGILAWWAFVVFMIIKTAQHFGVL